MAGFFLEFKKYIFFFELMYNKIFTTALPVKVVERHLERVIRHHNSARQRVFLADGRASCRLLRAGLLAPHASANQHARHRYLPAEPGHAPAPHVVDVFCLLRA